MTSTKPVIHPLESTVGLDVVEALTRFRLLTVPQLLAVTGRDEKTLRGRIIQLVQRDYVRHHPFVLGHMMGRLHSAYSLTAKGLKFAGSEAKPIHPSKSLSVSHVPHRRLIFDTLIAADRWAKETGQGLPTFRVDKVGQQTRLALHGKTADADAIIELDDTQNRRRFYVVEVYCDYLHNASSKPYEKLPPYIIAGVTNALDAAVGVPPSPAAPAAMVLVVVDSPEMRDRILRGLPKRNGVPPLDKRTWQRFLFKSENELADFGAGWHRVDGTLKNLPL